MNTLQYMNMDKLIASHLTITLRSTTCFLVGFKSDKEKPKADFV